MLSTKMEINKDGEIFELETSKIIEINEIG